MITKTGVELTNDNRHLTHEWMTTYGGITSTRISRIKYIRHTPEHKVEWLRIQTGHNKVILGNAWQYLNVSETPADVVTLIVILANHINKDNMISTGNLRKLNDTPALKDDILKWVPYGRDRLHAALKWAAAHFDIIKRDGGAYYLNPVYATINGVITTKAFYLFKDWFHAPYVTRGVAEAVTLQVTEYDSAVSFEKDEKEYERLFKKNVLRNKKPALYKKTERGMLREENYTPGDEEVFFLPNYAPDGDRKHVDTFYNMFLDLDIGKDENGEYFSDTDQEIGKRKNSIVSIIKKYPEPTAVIETRNGYHVYYTLTRKLSKERWQQLERDIVTRSRIADPAVKDTARVLRYPGSTWRKNDRYAPYPVTYYHVSETKYAADELLNKFIEKQDEIDRQTAAYEEAYRRYAPTAPTPTVTVPIAANDTVSRIKYGKPVRLPYAPEKPLRTDEEVRVWIRSVPLQDIFRISATDSFSCVFHDDRNPSARIFYDDEEEAYKYICYSSGCQMYRDNRGIDIIDIIEILQNVSYKQAIRYIRDCIAVTR